MIIGQDNLPSKNPFNNKRTNYLQETNNTSKDNKFKIEQQKRINITDQDEIRNKSFDILQQKLENGHITLEQYETIAGRINKNRKK